MLKLITLSWSPKGYAHLLLVLISISLSGCLSHANITQNIPSQVQMLKSVNFTFVKNYPDCIIILPVKGGILAEHSMLIENVLMRHFQIYFKKVISPSMRRSIVKNRAYNLKAPQELRHFSRSLNCYYGLSATVNQLKSSYAITYALRSVDITLEIINFNKGSTIWRQRHSDSRSAGGLPTGPLGLVMHSGSAHQFLNDTDGMEALFEDVIRRLSKRF